MYKPSRYNIIVENSEGDFLLYNTSKGIKSLYKLPRERHDAISILKNGQIEENVLTNKLAKSGFLVEQGVDEEAELELVYEKTVHDKQINLIISPTDDCNFRCIYCCEDFKKKYMSNATQQSILKFIEKNIEYSSGLNIDWFGGEPLMALDVVINLSAKIIQICKKAKKNYSAFITTNGYHLDLETFKRLYEYHVFTYQVSLDGVAAIHDAQRVTDNGEPTFDTIINNLLEIKASTVGKFATILVLTNLSSCLENDILEYKKLFNTYFANDRRFVFSCARIMNLGGNRIKDYSSHIIDSNGMNIMYSKLRAINNYKLNYSYIKFLNPGNLVCYAGKRNSFVIAPDGRLYKCEHIYQTRRDLSIGYIDKEGEMVLDDKQVALWKAKLDRCNSNDCKLKPLCLGEDCIKHRVLGQRDDKGTCSFNLCHFEKKTMENILLLLDHDCNSFMDLHI